jgi:hypothetical protein
MKIHTVGSRPRSKSYLKAVTVAGLMLIASGLGTVMYNTVALPTQVAQAVVTVPEHNYKLNSFFNKSSRLEFDKHKNLEIRVHILDGAHAGQEGVGHYNTLQRVTGMDGFELADAMPKGTRVNVEFTQRRLTGNLRVSDIQPAGAPQHKP